MSWKGFVKAIDRATAQIQQKTGLIERTTDKQYSECEQQYRAQCERQVRQLSTATKSYLDAMRAVSMHQKRLGELLADMLADGGGDGEDDDDGDLALAFAKLSRHMDEHTRTGVDAAYRQLVLDPCTQFVDVFPKIDEAIKRRNKKLLDYDSARAKVRRLVDHPSSDPAKLPAAERQSIEARDFYLRLNEELIRDLPAVVNMKDPYFAPVLENFEALDAQWRGELRHGVDGLPERRGGRTLDIESLLQRMGELTVVPNVNIK